MLQVARLAPQTLGEATENVRTFVKDRLHPDGGFCDRNETPDLYYTVFGLDCLVSLSDEIPVTAIERFLEGAPHADATDAVTVSSAARCWSAIRPRGVPAPILQPLADTLTGLRRADGGFAGSSDEETSSLYATFLGVGALQDLGLEVDRPDRIIRFVATCAADDGGYGNGVTAPIPMTPLTAAGVTLLRNLGTPAPPAAVDWLCARAHDEGGFFAGEGTPIPDLLSTATALHALAGSGRSLDAFREPGLDFVDTLWTRQGSFFGHWAETMLDTEYTFYGLLALGHLVP